MSSSSRLRIVIANLWTDRNKGDAAINIATVRVIRRCFPLAEIHAFTYFGANQMDVARKELSFTVKEDITSFNGGLFPTYHRTTTGELSKKGVGQKFTTSLIHFVRGLGVIMFTVFLLAASRLNLARMFCKIFPSEYRRSMENFISSDVIVISTSNIRERRGHLSNPYILYKELYHAILAIALRKPLALLGHSIWSLRNGISRSLVRWIMNRSILITVREEKSYENIKELEVDNAQVHVLPDFSFYLLQPEDFEMKRVSEENFRPSIGMVFVDWQEGGPRKRDNYINVMANFIKYLEKYKPKIVIVPQVDYPPEDPSEITKVILSSSGVKDFELSLGALSLRKLLEVYSQLDFVIATPVHSCVFSLSVGTPAIAIAYEEGPKHVGIMRMLGLEKYVLSYGNLTLESLTNLFEEAWQERLSIRVKALENSNLLKKQVLQHGLLLKEKILDYYRQ